MHATPRREGVRVLPVRAPGRGEVFPRLRAAVLIVWISFLAFCAYTLFDEPVVPVLCAAAIGTVALFPALLWTDGHVPGLPILPVHVLTLFWTYAIPLVSAHPGVTHYHDDEYAFATLCVAVYGIVATIFWMIIGTRPVASRRAWYVIPKDHGFVFFVTCIFLGGAFVAVAITGVVPIDPGLFGIVRASALAFTAIALFVLSVRLARGELTPNQRLVFLATAIFYVLMQLATIFLVGAVICVATALIGYTIGGGRVPWGTVVASLVLFGFLHSGKSEMREKYWAPDAPPLALHEIPVLLGEWVAAGGRAMGNPDEDFRSRPIYERVSLMHLLLLAQRVSPQHVAHMEGATLVLVPRLLIPRIFDPDKPHSHVGTSMLNIHYGVQSEEDTERTTVGWGLLNEGFANFGLLGVAAMAAFIGLLFGFVGRLTVGAPVMSLENMVGVTFAAIALQSEFTMGVFATASFQSLAVLLIIVPILQKIRPGSPA